MTERISKRLRYEVLRRDNYACRYCGASAPEAKLVVDAVVPQALGGSHTDPSNLVTACDPCNNGKGASNPDAPVVADVSADAIRWGRAIEQAAEVLFADQVARRQLQEKFAETWNVWGYGPDHQALPLPPGWRQSVDSLLAAGLPFEMLCECVDLAMPKNHVAKDMLFRYMCGIAWKKVNELREIAAKIVEAEAIDDESEERYGNPAGDYQPPPVRQVLAEQVRIGARHPKG